VEARHDGPVRVPKEKGKEVVLEVPKDKGKKKEVVLEGSSDSDGSYEDEPAQVEVNSRKRKRDVPEEKRPKPKAKQPAQPAPSQGDKRRQPPANSGRRRDPPCKRCSGKRGCFETKGTGLACLHCATMKMKCEPLSDDEFARPADDGTSPSASPPPTKPSAPAPAPAPRQKPKKQGTKKEPAPAPAPGPSLKRRKVVKTAEYVDSSDEDEDVEEVPSRRFSEFEAYYGKHSNF
jgi:hypothetical protein